MASKLVEFSRDARASLLEGVDAQEHVTRGIYIDEVTRALLDVRFSVSEEAGRIMLWGEQNNAAEVRTLLLALEHGRAHVCYSTPGEHDRIAEDFDSTGHLSRSVLETVALPRDADIYLCGPIRFMEEMKEALGQMGVVRQRIHAELFNGSEPVMPGVVGVKVRRPHSPDADANTGVLVSFARSGIAAHWNPSAYQSLLELAEACDVPVRWSCRTGVCQTCETTLIAGTVGYRPDPVEPPPDGSVLLCCSQARGDVVLDL